MKIYHQRDLKNLYITLLFILFFIEVVLIGADIVLFPLPIYQRVPQGVTVMQHAIILYTGITYVLISVAFLYYGIVIYYQDLTPSNVLPHLILFTLLSWFLFTLRGAFVIWNSVTILEDTIFWWVDLAYFGTLEVLPIALMLIVVFKIPVL